EIAYGSPGRDGLVNCRDAESAERGCYSVFGGLEVERIRRTYPVVVMVQERMDSAIADIVRLNQPILPYLVLDSDVGLDRIRLAELRCEQRARCILGSGQSARWEQGNRTIREVCSGCRRKGLELGLSSRDHSGRRPYGLVGNRVEVEYVFSVRPSQYVEARRAKNEGECRRNRIWQQARSLENDVVKYVRFVVNTRSAPDDGGAPAAKVPCESKRRSKVVFVQTDLARFSGSNSIE